MMKERRKKNEPVSRGELEHHRRAVWRILVIGAIVLTLLGTALSVVMAQQQENTERIERAACLEILFLTEVANEQVPPDSRMLRLVNDLDVLVDCDHDGDQSD